jgi:hypothetical protein
MVSMICSCAAVEDDWVILMLIGLIERSSGGPSMKRILGVSRRRMARRRVVAHVELKNAWGGHDSFRVMAVLEKGIPDGIGTAHEQAAVETTLFLRDPVAAAILTNKDDRRCRATQGRFDELHVSIPSIGE